MATNTGYFVLILKCTEAPVTTPTSTASTVAGEDTNMYEKIHMYQINNEIKFTELKNLITPTSSTLPENKYDKDNNHAIIFITLTNGEIATSDGYIEKKYFEYKNIRDNFITQIDKTAKEMDCYQSTYEIKGITSTDQSKPYASLTLVEQTPATANILINNGGKIVVTSSKNDDQLILHYVSKMFGFEDIMKNLAVTSNVKGGGDDDDDVDIEGGENNDFTQEELAEYQNQMEQQQQGGKKKRSKQNTKKRNQK